MSDLVFVGKLNQPTYVYTDNTGDLTGTTISGASIVGGTIFSLEDAKWYIIQKDLTLITYALPVEITVDPGSINIGNVAIDQPVANAIRISPTYGTQSVASSGTAEPLVSIATYAISLTVWPKPTNSGDIYFGSSIVNKTSSQQIILSAGGGPAVIDCPIGYKLDLHNFYVDAATSNDGVNFMYLK